MVFLWVGGERGGKGRDEERKGLKSKTYKWRILCVIVTDEGGQRLLRAEDGAAHVGLLDVLVLDADAEDGVGVWDAVEDDVGVEEEEEGEGGEGSVFGGGEVSVNEWTMRVLGGEGGERAHSLSEREDGAMIGFVAGVVVVVVVRVRGEIGSERAAAAGAAWATWGRRSKRWRRGSMVFDQCFIA